MKITQKLLTPNKYSRPQTPLKNITKVVVHYVGNSNTTAINNRNYFESLKVGIKRDGRYIYVSSHYIVGLQGEIIQCIPEDEVAYCSNHANGYSISIETCHPNKTGKFDAVTEQSLVELVADICNRHKLNPLTDVIRHYDVTGKHCPLWYVVHPLDWMAFKDRVQDCMKPREKQYKLEVFSFAKKEDADKVKDALLNLGVYAETYHNGKDGYKVVSYSYSSYETAQKVGQGLKLINGCYSEVKEMD